MKHKKPRTPFLSSIYQQYLDKQDTADFANRVSRCYMPGTLQRLVSHETREVRRAAVLALGILGDYSANHTLGCALLDEDRTVRMMADSGIRSLWARLGEAEHRQQLTLIVRLNTGGQYHEAIVRAGKLIDQAVWFAEAWYQRAAAQFALGRFPDCIRDCHQALEINPYHFVAATSMGQAYLELSNPVSALESFRRALRLNPDLEGVRAQVVRLTRLVEDK